VNQPQPIIEARAVEKWFDQPGRGGGTQPRIQAIAPTDLALYPDTIVALLGPSGSGKSTLLRLLAGLVRPTRGEVVWQGGGTRVAIVFQNFALFPWLTVQENVEAPLQAQGMPAPERRERALRMLDTVGLDGFESAYPKELSGGMKQRVGLARALAVEPEVLFMDEPFSAVDVLTAENLRSELLELWQDRKMPTRAIFMVTHNIEEAVLLADRLLILGRNPGHIRADLRVNLTHPRDRKAPRFTEYVDYVYTVLTRPQDELPPLPGARPARGMPAVLARRIQMLPHALPGEIGGLLEMLTERGGREDLFRVAEELHMEVDDLLPKLEAASLLDWARLHGGDVELTPEGRAFAEADIQPRKLLFRKAALRHVSLLRLIETTLQGRPDGTVPDERFRKLLRQHFTEEEAERQLNTALDWGRYAELFDYDAESGLLQVPELSDPAPPGRRP
jgi:NitT/TauT family transport system ATP-binding protein